MQDIIGEIGIVVGIGATYIVVPPAPALDKALELGYNRIVAAPARVIDAEAIMHLAAAVKRKHYIVHLSVAEIDDLIIDEDTVGGEGKAEIFPSILLHRTGIGHQLLDNRPIHQRLATEEINFQVAPAGRVFDKKIESTPGRFQRTSVPGRRDICPDWQSNRRN